MKRYHLVTLILMLLAFAAGWFGHEQVLETSAVQQPLIVKIQKPLVAAENIFPDNKNQKLPEKKLPPSETPESVLGALLDAGQYQRAVDFYRDTLQGTTDTLMGSRLYQLIQTYLNEQIKLENFTNASELSSVFLALNPRDYPVTLLNIKAHLALGERRQAIELLYGIVPYVADETEQQKIYDMAHHLSAEEYESASSQQQWKELDMFYQYLLIQENSYWPYYLNYAVVLMNLQDYTRAENQLLLLLSHDELKEQANVLLARITLLRAGGSALTLQQYGSNYIRSVTFNGVTDANLVLDTGASVSVLDPTIFKQLAASDYEQVQDTTTLHTANGQVSAPLYRIHTLQLGNYRLDNVEFAVLPVGNQQAGYSGLLGMNILNRFHFEIDQKNKQLILQPRL